MYVYTDGACTRNGYPDAFAGYGVHFEGKDWDISKRLRGKQTNNRAEMYAMYTALKRLYFKGVMGKVTIYTDSRIVQGGFVKRKNSSAANFDLWIKIYKAYDVVSKYCDVEVEWVKAHNGTPGNERADKLAVEGKLKPERKMKRHFKH